MLSHLLGKLARQLLARAPLEEKTHNLCKNYVDRFNGENNSDMRTNGEMIFLRRLLASLNGAVVFDVGANVGDWASAALSVNPSTHLHCFEPSRETFRRLRLAGLKGNVSLNNFGLGSENEERSLYIFEEGSAGNSLYLRRGLEGRGIGRQEGVETVSIRTLDDYCRAEGISHVDLMKLDVEGHELSVLRGGARLFAASEVSFVQFEYGGCNISSRILLADLFEFFTCYGYRLFKIFPDGLQPVPLYDQRMENFQYANYVAAAPHAGETLSLSRLYKSV